METTEALELSSKADKLALAGWWSQAWGIVHNHNAANGTSYTLKQFRELSAGSFNEYGPAPEDSGSNAL